MTRHQLDARGLRCPWPAIRLARAMRLSAPGDEITITVDDPKAEGEVEILARERGWTLDRVALEHGCTFTLTR
ncbi:MAG: sulfurtransferase TusA family protein [Sphingomonadaceae bacterium]